MVELSFSSTHWMIRRVGLVVVWRRVWVWFKFGSNSFPQQQPHHHSYCHKGEEWRSWTRGGGG